MSKSKLSLAFVGDMSFGDFLFCQGYGVRNVVKRLGANFLFSEVEDTLSESDFLFGNLEVVLSRQGEDPRSLNSVDMRGDPECILALKKAGFTILNVANNHSMQHGIKAFKETASLLKTNGIYPLGLWGKGKYYSQPVVLSKNGIKLGYLGYAFEVDRYYSGELPYAFWKENKIESDIRSLRRDVDVLIVSNHWGLEFMDRPSVATIRLARRMVDWGAHIIIGHHPHVIQGVEQYKDGLIAYSLGNFIFDMAWDKVFCESMILKVRIHPGGALTHEIIPVMIQKDYRPIPISMEKGDSLLKKIDLLSKKISEESTGDVEQNSLKYYTEYLKLRRRDRWAGYKYFFFNFYHYHKRYLGQQLVRTVQSKIEDFWPSERKGL